MITRQSSVLLSSSRISIPLLLLLGLCNSGRISTVAALRATSAAAVTAFELWDAEANEKITTLQNGAQIPMLVEGGFTIKVIVNKHIGSLAMSHNGVRTHIENYDPYFFCADNRGIPYRCQSLVEGEHTIEATPYSFRSAKGPAAISSNVTFTIVPADPEAAMPPILEKPVGGGTDLVPATLAPITATPVAPPSTIEPAPTPVIAPPVANGTTTTTGHFAGIRINCGGPSHTDAEGRVWLADQYYVDVGGMDSGSFMVEQVIAGTNEDALFHSERWGMFKYEIPVPMGDYQVILHFAEIFYNTAGSRKFGLVVENQVIPEFDIILLAGQSFTATRREIPTLVKDGFLSIAATKFIENPKISAIEVLSIGAHLAHSVPGGPYSAVAEDDGFASVAVDGTQSHTHLPNGKLTIFSWKEGSVVLGENAITSLRLPVGSHDVTLKVIDSDGNESIAGTVVNVLPSGFPDITKIVPNKGKLQGGDKLVIYGKGFEAANGIQFGDVYLSKSAISITSDNEITVVAPPSNFAVPVAVTVETALGESNSELFTYEVDGISISFLVEELLKTENPTAVAFGPDSKLYIGSSDGVITKCTLDDTYTKVLSKITSTVSPGRFILGLAFDPMETVESNPNPTVYFSNSQMFHGEWRNSYEKAINGKISAARGANLDEVTDIVTGLPVSDHDHGINGIMFGDNGELYIQLGGNTNGKRKCYRKKFTNANWDLREAGIPGELSSTQKMNENILSGATLVAHLGRSDFDGHITYDMPNNGNIVTGGGPRGVEVFASGMRNPYRIILHSNGKLYGTDNGANTDFGDIAIGCGPGEQLPDQHSQDELNLIQKGIWYGHANHKRAEVDPRQCVWNGPGHTPPIMELDSSTDGMIEFESDHFGGQLRGDIVLSKYKDGLRRVILNDSGTGVHSSMQDGVIKLQGDEGLDITQAPNGVLVDARFDVDACYFYEPIEPHTTDMEIKAVFPRRGSFSGGSKISIYGVNFDDTSDPLVSIGGEPCNGAVRLSSSKIQCTLPPNLAGSTVDVIVAIGTKTDTFVNGYRYIKGSE